MDLISLKMAIFANPQIIGRGTYGSVYLATSTYQGVTENVAIKRNFCEITASGAGSLLELDVLARFKGHPFIVDLKSVGFDSIIFNPGDTRDAMKEDKISFVLEYVPESLRIMNSWSGVTFEILRNIMVQILIAIEFIHANDVVHCDLKPENILIDRSDLSKIRIRICDFGMSSFTVGPPLIPHEIQTSWYRSPEVCTKNPYGSPIDMWSLGCIFYELVTGEPLLNGCPDNSVDAFNRFFYIMEMEPSREHVRDMFSTGTRIQIRGPSSQRIPFSSRIMMHSRGHGQKLKDAGQLQNFCSLLKGLFAFRPQDRLTASEALKHPFFKFYETYIEEFHRVYPPRCPDLFPIKIVDSPERRWMFDTVNVIVTNRGSLAWFNWKILFHGIELFDRYLTWASVNVPKRNPDDLNGFFVSRITTELYVYVCMYIFHKYFLSSGYPFTWETFFPAIYSDDASKRIGDSFETNIIQNASQQRLFQYSLLEVVYDYEDVVTDDSLIALLGEYSKISQWENKSIRSLYRHITNRED